MALVPPPKEIMKLFPTENAHFSDAVARCDYSANRLLYFEGYEDMRTGIAREKQRTKRCTRDPFARGQFHLILKY